MNLVENQRRSTREQTRNTNLHLNTKMYPQQKKIQLLYVDKIVWMAEIEKKIQKINND